jgi:uncharacterized RDD family membrane protein YckC
MPSGPAHPGAPPPPVGSPGYRPPPVAPGGRPLADFGERLLAYLIDGVVLAAAAVVVALLALPVLLALGRDWAAEADNPSVGEALQLTGGILAVTLVIIVIVVGFSYLYFVQWMYRTGQTWGKRALNIRVVPADPTRPLSRADATKRWLVRDIGGMLVPLFSWVDGLWQLWDQPLRQCLHDKVAQTVVVRAERR